MRRFGEYGLFYSGLGLFGVGCLLWSIPAGILHRALPRRWQPPLGQFMIMAGFRCFLGIMKAVGLFRCDLSALDCLRRDGALIIVSNHPSLLDAVLVISRLPRVICITKASLWDNVFLGGGIRLASYIRNDVPLKLVKRAVQELHEGHQLLIFPEGTRTIHSPIGSFKGGFALMALKANVPVQTVFLEGRAKYLGKGWPLFRKPEVPLTYKARLGRRFPVPDDIQAFVTDLEEYFRQELSADVSGYIS